MMVNVKTRTQQDFSYESFTMMVNVKKKNSTDFLIWVIHCDSLC